MIRIENIDALSLLNTLENESIDLVYIDPPFFTQRIWYKNNKFFSDHYKNKEIYIEIMKSIFLELHRVLKQSGTLLVHISTLMSPYLQVELDTIFGIKNRLNVLKWQKNSFSPNISKIKYTNMHEDILFYSKQKNLHTFNKPMVKRNSCPQPSDLTEKVESLFEYRKNIAKGHLPNSLKIQNIIKKYTYDFQGIKLKEGYAWAYKKPVMQEKFDKGEVIITRDKKGNKSLKYISPEYIYRNEIIEYFRNANKIGYHYPTQKPNDLLKLLIETHSNEGDIVLDCFLGGGTTAVVANALNRSFIGCDINPDSIDLTNKRLDIKEAVTNIQKENTIIDSKKCKLQLMFSY